MTAVPDTSESSRYEVREPLGAGGMGQVYRAYDRVLQRDVALKLLRADLPAGSNGRARLLREARMAATLSHPNICVVHDVGEIDGRPFVTMELLAGETLRRRLLRNPRVPVEEASRIGREVAAALAGAHGRGVIHRDIKPENVMLLPDGRVKVLDFGLAKALDAALSGQPPLDAISHISTLGPTPLHPHGTLPVSDDSLTTPGQILGTYHYLSPEQAEAKPADARSDVFSFGVVMYEMLAGHQPFTGPTAEALLAAIRADQPSPLEKTRPDVGAPLRDVVHRCLNKDPKERYTGGEQVREALARAAALMRRRARRLWAAVAGLVLMSGLAVAAALWPRGEASDASSRESVQQTATIHRLTDDGISSTPFYSPDGSRIAFRRQVGLGRQQAFVMSSAGGDAQQVSDLQGGFAVEGWMPNGEALHGSPTPWRWDSPTLEVPVGGGPPRTLLEHAAEVAFGPSADRLVFSRFGEKYSGEVRVQTRSTGEEQSLLAYGEKDESCSMPRWSPDGAWISTACFGRAYDTFTNLYLLPAAGGAPERADVGGLILSGLGGYYGWSRDGESIIASATLKSSQSAIWSIPIRGGGSPLRLTDGLQNDLNPTVDPSGRHIVFERMSVIIDLVFIDAASGELREAYKSESVIFRPAFWGDGRGVHFTHVLNGQGTIRSLPLEGGEPLPVTRPGEENCRISESVGEDKIVFVCGAVGADVWQTSQETRRGTVWMADRAGGARTALFQVAGYIDVTVFAVSPDERRFLYRAERTDRTAYRLHDRATGDDRELFEEPSTEPLEWAYWSPDGESLLLVRRAPPSLGSRYTGRGRIDRWHVASGRSETLMRFPEGTARVAVAPSLGLVVYTTRPAEGSGWRFWMRPLTGDASPRLVTEMTAEVRPWFMDLSADGRTIAVQRFRRQTSDLYRIDNALAPAASAAASRR